MKLPSPAGIFAKILLVALPPIVLLAVLLSAYVVDVRLDDLEQAFVDRGEADAREMASTALLGLFTGDRQMLQKASQQHLMRNSDLIEVVVRDVAGDTVAQVRSEFDVGDHPTRWFAARVEPPSLRFGQVDSMSPNPIGEVAVRFSERSAAELAARVVRNTVLIALAAVLLTVFVAVAVARQLVRPLLRLRHAVRRITEGDFEARVREDTAGEIGELEIGINTMADAIAVSTDRMQREVVQATADLQQTMDALEIRNIELDLARKRALDASDAKSEFLANISHEIRTPMNGVLGFARLLRKSELDESQIVQVDTIIESANVLLSTINEILDFSKMEAGKVTLERRAFSLREVLAGVTQLFSAQAQDKGIALASHVDPQTPDGLIGDPARLQQILNNLVGNAVKFTSAGRVTVSVASLPDIDNRAWLSFSVTDTGIGIPEDVLGQLFQPFSQGALSTTRLYGGTGLGLSICRRLAGAMGGEVNASSEVGAGSIFTVRLPFERALTSTVEEEKANATTEGRPGLPADWLAERLFLIADDNPINLRLVDEVLTGLGARTLRATDGNQAIELAMSIPIDMAIIDVHMPRLNGIEAAARMRAANAATPIVALTADVTLQQRLRAENADFFDCVIKPVNEEELAAVVAAALDIEFPLTSAGASPAVAPEVGPTPVRDRARAVSQAAGSVSIADALFGDFVEALPESLADIDAAHAAGGGEQLWQAAHRLQGAAATCSLPALYDALAELTRAARANDEQQTELAVSAVRHEAGRVMVLRP